jgi:xylulokinase
MAKLLTIDLGTTFFKVSLFDGNGQLCDGCRVTPPIATDSSGRMELLADAFLETLARGIGELRDRDADRLADVEAVTFATQTNSFVLLDGDNRPLTPIVLWPDLRATELDCDVRNRCSSPQFTATTGIPQMGAQFMVAKLLWLQRQQPDVWQRTKSVALISDFMTLYFTGKLATEAGAAGLTGLLDIHRCQWWPDMLRQFGLDESQLPEVVRAGTDLGPITPEAAERFGLPTDCRFVVGCLDQYAGAIGVGNLEAGMVSETTGTVLATVRCADHFAQGLDPGVFQGPAYRPGLYWRMAFGDTSANCLQWYRDQLSDRPEFDELIALAAQIAPGADGLRMRKDVRLTKPEEVFEGLTAQHTRGQAVRCIVEAVAFALADQMAMLDDGASPSEVRCAGGAARSDLWLQIKADVLDAATVATQCPEPTSLGAAILAEASLRGVQVSDVANRWVRLKPSHRPTLQGRLAYHQLRDAR